MRRIRLDNYSRFTLGITIVQFLFFLGMYGQEEVSAVDWSLLPTELQENIIRQCDDFKEYLSLLSSQLDWAPYQERKKIVDFNSDTVWTGKMVIKEEQLIYTAQAFHQVIDKTTRFSTAITKFVVVPRIPCLVAFASLSNGEIYKINPGKARIHKMQKAHSGSVIDMAIVEKRLISCGVDGSVTLWDHELNEYKTCNFNEVIGADPRYIHYLEQENLILVESEAKDYVYFDSELTLVKHLRSDDMVSFSVPPDSICITPFALMEELIKMKRGVPFATYQLLRGIHYAMHKKRPFFVHEKEMALLDAFPILREKLKKEKYIGQSSILTKGCYTVKKKAQKVHSLCSSLMNRLLSSSQKESTEATI